MPAVSALPLLAALLQTSPSPAVSPQAVPTPPPVVSPAPSSAPSPAPSTTPTPPGPSPSATPMFAYVVKPSPAPTGQPQIVEVALNDRVQHENGDLLIRVTTSPDVFQVMLRSMGRQIALPQAAAGIFGAQQRLPGGIPFFFLNRWYNVDIIASTQDGRSTTVSLPVRLER